MDDKHNRRRAQRVRSGAGLLLIAGGVLLFGTAAYTYWPVAWGWVAPPAQLVPATFDQELREGTFEIAIASLPANPDDPRESTGPDQLEVLAASVHDPHGHEVAVVVDEARMSLPCDVTYIEWAKFEAKNAGRYEYQVDTSPEAIVIVRRSLQDRSGIAATIALISLLALGLGLYLAISRRGTGRPGAIDLPPPTPSSPAIPPPDPV